MPKLVLTNSSWEYWRGDGALVHQDPVTGADLPEDPDARSYLISGTDHIGPTVEMKRSSRWATRRTTSTRSWSCEPCSCSSRQWVVDGIEPAPSAVPRQSDETAVSRASVLDAFPDAARPDVDALPYTPEIDPDRCAVAARAGRAARRAGVRAGRQRQRDRGHPPARGARPGVAAYTGWNPRRHVDGLPDVLYDMIGSRLPSRSAGAAPGEPELRAAARQLARSRFLLEEDVELAVRHALADQSGTG